MTAIAQKENHFQLYSLSHFYLSTIQQGVQSTRLTASLINKYQEGTTQREMLREWPTTGAEVRLLNGGNTEDLIKYIQVFDFIASEGMDLPYTAFFESEANFGGALTSVGILVPREIYAHPGFFELDLDVDGLCAKYPNTPQWHLHLIHTLRNCQPAC